MPPARPTQIILKPSILDALDRASAHSSPKGTRQLIQLLRKNKDLVSLAVRYGWIAGGSTMERHLRKDWFDEDGSGWWPGTNAREVLRQGFIHALELLRDKGKPFDCWWLSNQPVGGDVSVIATLSKQQLTVLIQTPPPGGRGARRTVPSRNAWVTQRKGRSVRTSAAPTLA